MQVLLQWHRWTNFDPSRMEWNSWFSDLSRDCDEIFNIQFCFILLIRKLAPMANDCTQNTLYNAPIHVMLVPTQW